MFYICSGLFVAGVLTSEYCETLNSCPDECICEGSVVDCSGKGLLEIPSELPRTTKKLLLQNNKISTVFANGLFNRLPRLTEIDLSRNELTQIEDGAFEGALSITNL